MKLTHLQRLEAESIHIKREVVAECEHLVMLNSVGKDLATMLHLARKAFGHMMVVGAAPERSSLTLASATSSARAHALVTPWLLAARRELSFIRI